ncbi:Methyltransferase domain family [Synechococcus sp. PCC 7335]|uniref:class I SAM-dependent methyltransferase n=1 Tax=Synechococcus sp. (strain ATCC 29403 / PCC 7335) TaxID=91464 RepID=UPI00017ED901|nr:class I SAM-dependent methyltransferase [Synechococcus sp. PCC 7335]EDX86544.1 Methyltransferase domain family [Synechococcus sp. PCC 7335]
MQSTQPPANPQTNLPGLSSNSSKTETDTATVSSAVAKLYDAYPFPPEPLLDEAPPGYNWRWTWPAAYSFCTGRKPETNSVRILDAGCGTGVSTEYLVHLNPEAEVVGIDLSAGAIAVAKERCQRSGADRASFYNTSIYDVEQIPGKFDLINCVGVLHHLPDPIRGIQALAKKLKPGGIFHIFVYAELGRWEIQLTQEAIALLQGDQRGDYKNGVAIGRNLFSALPKENRLRQREETRWALENQRDECFADMYVHPQEIDYNVKTLFDLIDASGLDFVGFSNPQYWDLSRLIGSAPDLMDRAAEMEERDRYRLIEVLDPELTHFEFFLSRPPLEQIDWDNDETLLTAIPERHPCIEGWPSRSFFNYDYQVVSIGEAEFAFMEKCDPDQGQSVAEILTQIDTQARTEGLDMVRSLQNRQLIMLATTEK